MSKNIFNSVRLNRPKRNKFDLTHDVKMSAKFGKLYPVLCCEAVPGDTFHLGCDMMVRFAPMLAPIMHRVNVSVHYFFVPNRLVWPKVGSNKGWEDFITGSPTAGAMPYLKYFGNTITTAEKQALDYFGINPDVPNDATERRVNAIPFAAYQKIWNEYYRDQNQSSPGIDTCTDGDNSANLASLLLLRLRCWEHDYFTAALPTAQKSTAVDLPLGVVQLNPEWGTTGMTPHPTWREITTNNKWQNLEHIVGDASQDISGDGVTGVVAYDPAGTLEVGATTINDLRTAFKLQEWLERMMLGGSRYTESIWSMFGVKSPDARLQRPEYITGVKAPVVISEVLNMTGTATAAQGTMSGHGVSVASGKSGSYFCQEHGYIIGVLSVLPRTAYQQGVPRHFFKDDYLDFFFPQFAHLGEQAVENKEIYAYGSSGTFGYVPRYAEYKFLPSRVAGDFRTSLDFWHLGRKFGSQPALNTTFVECDPTDNDRIFAVQDGTDYLWMHLLHRVTAIRPMPVFGTPSI